MDFYTFESYIKASQKESDWIDNFYILGFEGLADKIFSYDNTINLLSYIFHDNYDILNRWVYETNYGRDANVHLTYDNTNIVTIMDIWQILTQIYNKEIEWYEIRIRR